MTKINVINGMGREVNPHTYYENDMFLSYAYIKFKEAHPEYPCFDNTGKVVEDGEYSAELRYQYQYEDGTWASCPEQFYRSFENKNAINDGMPKEPIRQVYIIQPTAEPFGREPVSYDTTNYSEVTAEGKPQWPTPSGTFSSLSTISNAEIPPTNVTLLNIAESKEPAKVREGKPDILIERLTVKKLKEIIADLPDDLEVTIGSHSIKQVKRKTLNINFVKHDLLILNDDLDYCY